MIKTYKEQEMLMASLGYGKDLLREIETIVCGGAVTAGSVVIIGAVSGATFGYYDQKEQSYMSTTRQGRFEIVSCSGNISLREDKTFVHAHILFGCSDGSVFGGHLMSPTTVFAAEATIAVLSRERVEAPNRKYDEITGLYLWV